MLTSIVSYVELIIAIFTASYVVVAMSFIMVYRKKKIYAIKERKNEFFDLLIKGLNRKLINNLSDVYNIYKGIYKNEIEDGYFRKNINNLLKQCLVKVITESDDSNSSDQVDFLKTKIDSFIKENEETSPFAGLPSSERNMLMDIIVFLEKGDNHSIERKVKELSSLIQIRNEQLEKLERLNKWSIPLSIVGLVLTILFGVLTIF